MAGLVKLHCSIEATDERPQWADFDKYCTGSKRKNTLEKQTLATGTITAMRLLRWGELYKPFLFSLGSFLGGAEMRKIEAS